MDKKLQKKFSRWERDMNGCLINRKREIRAALLALIARTHLLLLGPPGTAKSMLAQTLAGCITGAEYFQMLMTRFSLPEEVWGPMSVSGLKQDRFERVLAKYLATAEVAFVDEIFKANSSILNTMLTGLNERTFRNGVNIIQIPLMVCIGASNELPEGKENAALYDRFLLRLWVEYLPDRDSRKDLLELVVNPPTISVSKDEIVEAQEDADEVEMDEVATDLVLDIWQEVEKAGFVASDRRYRASIPLLKANAWLDGRDSVDENDLMLLADVLWNDPKDHTQLLRVITKAANPALCTAQEILDACTEQFNRLPVNKSVPDHETAAVFQSIVEANAAFKGGIERLNKLTNGRQNSAIEDIAEKIRDMAAESTKFANRLTSL